MRGLVLAALACALAFGAGCGESSPRRGQRAGSEPLPSSGPGVSVPASSSAPMFPGSASGAARRGGGGGPPTGILAEALARDERRREELGIGPDRLESLDAQGRRIALEAMQQMREAQAAAARGGEGSLEDGEREDRGPCDEAWRSRVGQGHHRGRRAALREQRNEFMRTCRALPEAQQRCLSLSYLSAHAEECARIQEQAGRRALERARAGAPD